MKGISQAAKKLSGQPMFHILAKANELERQGRHIIHLELGDPDFTTPKTIIDAAYESLCRGETHYTNSMGLLKFRTVVSETTVRSRQFKPDLDQILVCPGANSSIFYTIACTTNPGEEVIVPTPCFPTYLSAIDFLGAKPVFVPLKEENEFRLDPADVEKAITDKTRLIVMNSPHNPTGSVMTPDEVEQLYRVAEKHDCYLLSDEIYTKMIYPDETTQFSSPSLYDHCKERVLVANGFSKSYAMTGWRLGVVIGPKELIKYMNLLLETNVSCVSPFVQEAGAAAIKGDQTPITEMMDRFRQRRELLVDKLNELPGIHCLKPGGAFYVFPNISGTGLTDTEFCDYMLEHAGVACCPGSFFGEGYSDYVRFCYASSEDAIAEACDRMNDALRRVTQRYA